MSNPSDLERAARQSLSLGLQEVLAPFRGGLDFAKSVRAQAQPIIGLTEGIQKRIDELNTQTAQIQAALDLLEPHSSIPALQPMINYFKTLKPIVEIMAAAEMARLAAAALIVPSPAALAAYGQYQVVKTLEGIADQALEGLIDFVEGGSN